MTEPLYDEDIEYLNVIWEEWSRERDQIHNRWVKFKLLYKI